VTEVLPLLYLHGLSSSDFVPALGQALSSCAGLSSSGHCVQTCHNQTGDIPALPYLTGLCRARHI
jgi:hypothetical protein